MFSVMNGKYNELYILKHNFKVPPPGSMRVNKKDYIFAPMDDDRLCFYSFGRSTMYNVP